MIDESNLLNFYCSGIYDSTKALTETEIIMKVLEKLNLVILNFNNLESQTLIYTIDLTTIIIDEDNNFLTAYRTTNKQYNTKKIKGLNGGK